MCTKKISYFPYPEALTIKSYIIFDGEKVKQRWDKRGGVLNMILKAATAQNIDY